MRDFQSRLSDYNGKEFLADIDGGFAKLTVLHIKAQSPNSQFIERNRFYTGTGKFVRIIFNSIRINYRKC
jgi:hypothetical protein